MEKWMVFMPVVEASVPVLEEGTTTHQYGLSKHYQRKCRLRAGCIRTEFGAAEASLRLED